MTLYSQFIERQNSMMIANTIREYDPHIPIILGGPHCSLFPKRALDYHHADICLQGPGEFIINPIVEALEGKRKLSSIPGLYYKKGREIKKTKPTKYLENLDLIPFPARHLVDKYTYGKINGIKVTWGKVTSFITSRGCPYNCKFCGIHAYIPRYHFFE